MTTVPWLWWHGKRCTTYSRHEAKVGLDDVGIIAKCYIRSEGERERGREGEREGGREGERGRERKREREREKEREGERERESSV